MIETEYIRAGIHSDLVLESAEMFQQSAKKKINLPIQEYNRGPVTVTEVRITEEEQVRVLKRKKGTYITLYADELKGDYEPVHETAAALLGEGIRKLLPHQSRNILIAGLGNAAASPDALGPDAVSQVRINRHLLMEAGEGGGAEEWIISSIIPGVMAQTGLETAEILNSITGHFHPDVIIVIDALAAGSVTRLGTTIQITDTGISPGSGIGNTRQEISRDTMGVPVIAIGVPMVVEAASIIYETTLAIRHVLEQHQNQNGKDFLKNLNKEEQIQLFRELLEQKANPLYVTVKDIDEMEKRMAETVAEGVNRAFYQKKEKPFE